ncbi:tripartite tricarboxylate transporter TctB family protein [Marinivivus vitaminiproducens]|uniref:tripartite tricarboxylate transporter TctB family protein n=1 Tax=Marinivivus vitaminiproducens TaxID=3035935 RepID=UPI0027A54C1C|nr:tripartite tricarboxylate transporter TctB family protein [Geminicoccaceae bacterium SCSIO 64248]
MIIKRAELPEFLIGAFVVLLGLAAAIIGSGFGFGSAASMESGFFPVVIGGVLAMLGVAHLVVAVFGQPSADDGASEPVNIRAIMMISAGMAFWLATVKSVGLIPATIGLVTLSAYAERSVRLVRSVVLAAVLAAAAYGIFVYGLELPLIAFRWPL